MNMAWFEKAVAAWPGAEAWTEMQIRKAAMLYKDISLASGGDSLDPAAVDEHDARRHALASADDVLDARARHLARALIGPLSTAGYVENAEPVRGFRFLHRSRWIGKINVNSATVEALEALPVLGSKLSDAIVRYRKAQNGFRNLAELRAISGIGDAGVARLERYLYVGALARPLPRSDALDEFLSDPRFVTLVQYFVRTGYDFYDSRKRSSFDLTHATLADVLTECRSAAPARRLPASEIHARNKSDSLFADIAASAATDVQYSTLLFDGRYLAFLGQLLPKARRSIRMMMFLMTYDASRQHPSNRVVKQLIAAHRRGVDMRVILDIDTLYDRYNTRKANKAAFHALKAAGVQVKRDKKRLLLHAKSIVVDDEHVVVGSHNLTRGSAEVYDDTSCYLRSKKMAAASNARFDDLWRQLR